MSITVLFSGPAANISQAKNALTGAGLAVLPGDSDYGFAPSAQQTWTGERDEDGRPVAGTGEWVNVTPPYPVAFVAATGGDVDAAATAARKSGYVLRASWPTTQTTLGGPGPLDDLHAKFARQEARMAELERQLVALRGA